MKNIKKLIVMIAFMSPLIVIGQEKPKFEDYKVCTECLVSNPQKSNIQKVNNNIKNAKAKKQSWAKKYIVSTALVIGATIIATQTNSLMSNQ
jgi:uncharacterized membrane protein YcjF (UPF0283 family)